MNPAFDGESALTIPFTIECINLGLSLGFVDIPRAKGDVVRCSSEITSG